MSTEKQREADYRAVIAAIRRVADGYRAPLAAQVVNECAEAADRAWSGGGDAHAAESNVRSGLHAVTGAAHPPNAGNEELERAMDWLANSGPGDTVSATAGQEPWKIHDEARAAISALFAERAAYAKESQMHASRYFDEAKEREAQVAAIVSAADDYRSDPIDARDRPQSWMRLDHLLTVIHDTSGILAREHDARIAAPMAALRYAAGECIASGLLAGSGLEGPLVEAMAGASKVCNEHDARVRAEALAMLKRAEELMYRAARRMGQGQEDLAVRVSCADWSAELAKLAEGGTT